MSDIVKWLYINADDYGMGRCEEAADWIISLRAENAKLREANELLLTDVRRTDVDMRKMLADNKRLRAALKPFANAIKGNWSHQSDEMPIDAGFGASDLRLRFRLGDFRIARAALGGE